MKTLIGRLTNLLIATVNIFLLIFNTPAVSLPKQLDLSGYELTFCDEFDGDVLNTKNWRVHNDVGQRKGGYWSLDCAEVRDGNLVITNKYLENGEFGAGFYTCGLSTEGKFEQTFGYYEICCILPAGVGLWSAFWLTNPAVTTVTGTGKTGTEIDVFESPFYYRGSGRNNLITTNLHYNGYELQTRYKNVGIFSVAGNPYEEYNTYGVEWTPNEYIFYINGVETGRSSYGGVSKADEYMIVSCEFDGAEGKPMTGWSRKAVADYYTTNAPQFKIDYVKAYAKSVD